MPKEHFNIRPENIPASKESRKEHEIPKAGEAIQGLYDASMRSNLDMSSAVKYQKIIEASEPYFREGLQSKDQKKVFETLRLLNTLNETADRLNHNTYYRYSELRLRELSLVAQRMQYEGISAIDQNKPEHFSQEEAHTLLTSLKCMFADTQDHVLDTAIKFFEKHKSKFVEHNGQEWTKEKNTVSALEKLLNSPIFEVHMAQAIEQGIDKRGKRDFKYGQEYLERTLAKYDLDPHRVLQSWLTHGRRGKKKLEPLIVKNIESIHTLEEEKQGLAGFLFKQYGIRNFERYPPEVLARQYHERNETKRPYGVVLNPTYDWNGAFSFNAGVWRKLFDEIEGKYAIRFLEAGGKFEIARHLLKLDRRYGATHRISFAFIGGHGNKNVIEFGGKKPKNLLRTANLLSGAGIQKTKNFFEKNPAIVLISCSTGARKGIGQELSKMLGAKVIAPKSDAGLPDDIRVSVRNGRIDFEIKYALATKEATQTYVQGKTKEQNRKPSLKISSQNTSV